MAECLGRLPETRASVIEPEATRFRPAVASTLKRKSAPKFLSLSARSTSTSPGAAGCWYFMALAARKNILGDSGGAAPVARSLKPSSSPLVWASASVTSTPGMMARPGKWPANCGSSGRSVRSAMMSLCGSSFITRSTNRNGGRCGSTGRMSSRANSGLLVMAQAI